MKNQNLIIGCLATAVVTGGIGFFAGTHFNRLKFASNRALMFRDDDRGQNLNYGGRNNQQGPNNKMGFRNGMINGEVSAKDDKSLTIKLPDGSSKIVILSTDTKYQIASPAKLDDIQVGKTITLQGTINGDGSTTANVIELK